MVHDEKFDCICFFRHFCYLVQVPLKQRKKRFIDENIDFARAQIGNEIGVIEASGKCLNPVTLKTDSSVYYCGYADWRSGLFPRICLVFV